MTDQTELESLYREAQSALKARDYDRASGLLKQILVIDENYKDTSRLLAQTVTLRRRRWYNDPRLWGTIGVVVIIALGFVLAPRISGLFAKPVPFAPTVTIQPTNTVSPTDTPVPTETAVPTPTSVPLTWKRINIGQEFERDTVTAIVIDPKDRDVLYAGMKNAGIYKSIDGGLSWRPAHHGLSNAHVVSLLIDFENPRILYAGTLDGIFRTEDGGESWNRTGEGIYLLMDPQDSSHLYARDSDGIRESTDQGKSWKNVYSTKEDCPGEILAWTIHPEDGNTLFISGGENCEPGIYQSDDGGRAWVLIRLFYLSGNYQIHWFKGLEIRPDKQGNYCILSSRGLDHKENGTWKTILELDFVSATFDSTGLVYFYCDFHLCKFNLDDEQRVTLGKPDVGIVTSIAVSSIDPNTIYVGGKGISVSKDGGLTWTKLNNGLGSTMLQLEIGLDDAGTLYLLSGNCQQIRFPQAGSKRYGHEISQLLYISTNGGQNWFFSTQMGCYLIKDADGVALYRISTAVEWNGEFPTNWIWQSQDGGKSWERIVVPSSPTTLTADSVQSGLLYLYLDYDRSEGVNYHQYISEDHGNKWRANNPEVGVKLCYGSNLQFVDAYRPMAIDPRDGDHIFVIDNGTLLESHDSCDTTSAFGTAPNASMNSIAFDRNKRDALYAGTDEGAYVSFDSGKTWNQINDGLLGATVVYSIVVDKDSNVYAATPYGIFKLENK